MACILCDHQYFASCVVYDYPYRRYYSPYRYSLPVITETTIRTDIITAYANGEEIFTEPGSRVHRRDGRVVRNRDFNPNRRNTMVAEHGRRDTNATQRGIAKRDDNKARPSTSRGIAKKADRGNLQTTKEDLHICGIAQKVDRGETSVNKGRPATSRGIAKKETRGTSVNKGKPVSQRGIASKSKRSTSVSKERPTSRGIATTNRSGASNRKAVNKRPVQNRSKASSNSGSRNINRSTTSRPSNNKTVKRSTSSKSSTSGSRRAPAKRGRGL